MRTQTDLRRSITDQIVEALERGCAPWRRPWSTSANAGSPRNAVSGKSYSGVNPLLLELAAQRHGFSSRWWGTYKQWGALGGHVMARPDHVPPGGWGTSIVFCKPLTKPKRDGDGDEQDETFWTLRSYVVFSADQVVGDAVDRFRVADEPADPSEIEQRFEAAERAIAATGADIRFGGDRAYYLPTGDYIQIPPRSSFSLPEYYPTLFHELAHWSEHESRLNWDRTKPENSYAIGELMAELASCYAVGELGLPIEQSLDNHASYLQHWLTAMKADSRYLFRATAQASKASDYLLSFSRAEQAAMEAGLTA